MHGHFEVGNISVSCHVKHFILCVESVSLLHAWHVPAISMPCLGIISPSKRTIIGSLQYLSVSFQFCSFAFLVVLKPACRVYVTSKFYKYRITWTASLLRMMSIGGILPLNQWPAVNCLNQNTPQDQGSTMRLSGSQSREALIYGIWRHFIMTQDP